MTRVAFIGVGTMGGPMARNLIKGGHDVAVHDAARAAFEAFANTNAMRADSAAQAAERAEVLITMLPDSGHVRDTLFGPEGALSTLPQGALVVDMSTIAAAASMAIGDEVIAGGWRFMDAPVGRTPAHAQRGELSIMVGGAAADLEQAWPLFECMGNEVTHVGPRGDGIKLKLVNNYMSMVGYVMTAEALTLARKVGLDRGIAVRVISSTAAGQGQVRFNYPNKVLAGDITPDFPIRFGLKDLSLALEFSGQVNAPMPLGGVAREMFSAGIARGRGGQDCTAMLLLFEELAGLEPSPVNEP